MSAQRINKIRKHFKQENLDGILVTHLDQIRYLTGFTGSAGLLVITTVSSDFLTDFRYTDQAKKEVRGAKVIITSGASNSTLKEIKHLKKKNLRLGYDPQYLTVLDKKNFKTALLHSILISAPDIFEELGWVKDKSELALIKKAVKISDIAFERIINIVVPGVGENELAAELEYQMIMLGSEKPAFETIVASGYRSAMPHGVASSKKVKKGDFITFDFGATSGGYVSDITRTVVVGKATSRQKKIYNLVLKSHLAGIRKVKSGIMGQKVDKTCRDIITKAGFGKNFGHGTGHGIGYYVHVGPSLSPRSKDKLMTNNVITIEPGIYISGWGGVRIEDDVVVTKNGGIPLNKSPKNLLEL